MKAYIVSSWGDDEYFLNETKAKARADELRISGEELDQNEALEAVNIASRDVEVFEIDIAE